MNRNQFQLVVALTLTASAPAIGSQNNLQELKRSLESFSTASPKKAKPDSNQLVDDEDNIVIHTLEDSPRTKKRERTGSRESLVNSKDKLPSPPTKQSKTEAVSTLVLTKSQLIEQFLQTIKADKLWSKSDIRSVKKLLNNAPDTRITFILETLTALTIKEKHANNKKQSAKDHKSIIRKLTRLNENLLEGVKNVTNEFILANEVGGVTNFVDILTVLMETPETDFPTAIHVMTILAPSTRFDPYVPYESIIDMLSNLQSYKAETVLNNFLLFTSGSSWRHDKEDLMELLRAITRIKDIDRLNAICLIASSINHDGFSDAIGHFLEVLDKLDGNKLAIIQEYIDLIQQSHDAKSVIAAIYFIPIEQCNYFIYEATRPVVVNPIQNQVIAAPPVHQAEEVFEYEDDGYAANDYHPQHAHDDEEIEGDYNYDAYDILDDEDEDDDDPYPYMAVNFHALNEFQVAHASNQMLLRHAIDIQYDEVGGFDQLISHWRRILESDDQDASSELIQLITYNFRRMGLTEIHPLVELAQTVNTFINTNDRNSPYYIYAQMRMKKERALDWSALPSQTCAYDTGQLFFRPKNLWSFCSSLTLDLSQAPDITADKFINMLSALKTRLTIPNFSANFVDLQSLNSVIARNQSNESHLQTLLRAPENNRITAKLKCILKNYLNIIVTDIRLKLFANFLLSVQNCTVGQNTAIEEIYCSLPPKARLHAHVDNIWSKDNTRKALQILGQAIERVSMEHFSEGSTFVRMASGLDPKMQRQAAHQVQALRGLIGDYVGLPSELKFDMNAPLIEESILRASCEDLVKLFYEHNKLETMLPALKRTINEEIISLLPRDNEIYAHFVNIYGDQIEDRIIMVYENEEDLIGKFQGLSDNGIIGLLKHVNILEEVE